MQAIARAFVSLDAYGEPISVNYKGETTFKTGLGALWTLAVKLFLLAVGVGSLLSLFGH